MAFVVTNEILLKIVETVAVVAISGLFFQLLSRFIRRVGRVAGLRLITDRTVRDVLRGLWILTAAAAVLTIWSVASDFGILTISGIAGLVVSLALQATLSNMISGIFLFRDQLVRLGDVIEFGSVKGRVIRLALRNTWVLTEDGRVAVIGNSSLASGPLINHSASKGFALSLGGGFAPEGVGPPPPSS